MFPLYEARGFTYDSLSEVRPSRLWSGLATVLVAGLAAIVVMASDGQPVEAVIADDPMAEQVTTIRPAAPMLVAADDDDEARPHPGSHTDAAA